MYVDFYDSVASFNVRGHSLFYIGVRFHSGRSGILSICVNHHNSSVAGVSMSGATRNLVVRFHSGQSGILVHPLKRILNEIYDISYIFSVVVILCQEPLT